MDKLARTPEAVLAHLRKRSDDIFHLALVLKSARTLAEWDDAQDSMAEIMEQLGDEIDQVDQVHLGFVDDVRHRIPTKDLIARGKRLEHELHRFCQGTLYASENCDCKDCEAVRNFKLEEVD